MTETLSGGWWRPRRSPRCSPLGHQYTRSSSLRESRWGVSLRRLESVVDCEQELDILFQFDNSLQQMDN